jgi:hypothetical protein
MKYAYFPHSLVNIDVIELDDFFVKIVCKKCSLTFGSICILRMRFHVFAKFAVSISALPSSL